MADKTYITIVTNAGSAAEAAAIAGGSKIDINTFSVGDGAGAYYLPTADMTALKNKKWSGGVTGVRRNADNPNIVDISAVVPSSVGGFTIREMSVAMSDGTVFAICNVPDIEKTALSSGAAGEIELVMHIQVSSAASVSFSLDPNVVTATKGDLNAHNVDASAHANLVSLITELANRIRILENTAFNYIGANSFIFKFNTLEGVTKTGTGIWNETLHRIEC